MGETFFDDEFIKSSKIVSCPCCNSKFKIDLHNTEVICDECGESFKVELNDISEDFVWCPNQKY
jgi:transcription elongation factor Elf1